MKTYCYECPTHGVFATVVEFEDRDKPQPCKECGADSTRTWEGAGPMVLNHSFRDGHKRFDAIRETSKLRKEKADARARGDLDRAARVSKEIIKVNK